MFWDGWWGPRPVDRLARGSVGGFVVGQLLLSLFLRACLVLGVTITIFVRISNFIFDYRLVYSGYGAQTSERLKSISDPRPRAQGLERDRYFDHAHDDRRGRFPT